MKPPIELKGYDLRAPRPPVVRRLILSSEGDTGTGKSDFALRTAPRPLLHINLDHNIEPIEERYTEGDILIYDVKMPVDIDKERDLEQFKSLRKLILTSIEKKLFRTISIDTGDALYELCRRGFLGALGFGEAKQSDFDVVNANMRKFYRSAKDARINLYVAHKRKDEYKDSINPQTGKKTAFRTGQKRMDGWKDTQYEAQCHVIFEKDPKWSADEDEGDPDPYGKFTMTVLKCTANTDLEGTVFRGREISYQNLGTQVFQASGWKDWL